MGWVRLASTWLSFNYNQVPSLNQPSQKSCDVICTQHEHHNKRGLRGNGIAAARSVGFCQTLGPQCCSLSSSLPRCCVWKMVVLIFAKRCYHDSLSNGTGQPWHALCWCHILDSLESLGTPEEYVLKKKKKKGKVLWPNGKPWKLCWAVPNRPE